MPANNTSELVKTATFIKKLDGFTGDARLYQLNPPIGDYRGARHEFVVVSATSLYVTETYIFPADDDGCVTDWGELDGSYRGDTDHEHALRLAGYEVVA